jgi:hypothetical protein
MFVAAMIPFEHYADVVAVSQLLRLRYAGGIIKLIAHA